MTRFKKTFLRFGLLVVILVVAYSFYDSIKEPQPDHDFFEKNYVVQNGEVFQKDPRTGEIYAVTTKFSDGFENVSKLDDLITPTRWHEYNNVDPTRAGRDNNYYDLGNRINIVQDLVHSGKNSLRFIAIPSSERASKASIAKQIMYYKKGDHIYFSGWFYLKDTPSIYDAGGFTIFDLESTFIGYAGLRIIFRSEDSLAFELEQPKTQFKQDKGSEVSFPTGRWVHIKTHTILSDIDNEGGVQIWQDGKKVLDKKGQTLPSADAIFDRFELGISAIAKGSKYEKVLYIDDVQISNKPID